MKRLIAPATIVAALLVVCLQSNVSFAQKDGEKSKGEKDQVKLLSNDVEVIEISDKAEKCPGDATSLKLRVKSEKPIDVRLHYTRRRSGWAYTDYLNKKNGEEINAVDCVAKTRYKVQTRAAGSERWPNE